MKSFFPKICTAAAAIFASIVLFEVVGPLLAHPGRLVPSLWGDGGKNILSFLGQVRQGGYWFQGMNYPYGEHVIYTDGQPLLSCMLGSLHVSDSTALSLMWALISLSILLCTAYCYKLLVLFKVRKALALLFAPLICVLNPQYYGILGHYGLSYSCIIPMILYGVARYHFSRKIIYPAVFLLLLLVASFLHPYYSAVALVIILAYLAGYWLFIRPSPVMLVRHAGPYIIAVGVLFATIALVIRLSDRFTERPVAPYGTLVYCTTGEQILSSADSPVWAGIKTILPKASAAETGEAVVYPGLAAVAVLVAAFCRKIFRKSNKPLIQGEHTTQKLNKIWLFMAAATLLLGMGVPFVWNMEWLLRYLSFFRQFRNLGRFSWVFYFLIAIYAARLLAAWFESYWAKNKKVTASILLVFSLALWTTEAYGYILHIHNFLSQNQDNYKLIEADRPESWERFLASHGRKSTDFQALLILRFFEVGTDKLWLGGDRQEEGISIGSIAGLQLHLPIVDAMMARSSWPVAQGQVKIIAGPYADKPIIRDLPNQKPLLLFCMDNEWLNPDERWLLEAADSIGHFNNCTAYALYPERLRKNQEIKIKQVKEILPFFKTGDTCINGYRDWIICHFDSGTASPHLFGTAAQPLIPVHDTMMAAIPLAYGSQGREYEFSCWFLLSAKTYRSPYFKLEFLDSAGQTLTTQVVLTKESSDSYGLWFRAGSFFAIPQHSAKLRINLVNDPDHSYIAMDEWMLRPSEAIVVSKDVDGHIMVNNHLFRTIRQ